MTSANPARAILPPHPLDAAGVVKIHLGEPASAALKACGPFFLALVAAADCTAPPAMRGSMILLCLPLDKARADAAANVALGKARAVKISTRANGGKSAGIPTFDNIRPEAPGGIMPA